NFYSTMKKIVLLICLSVQLIAVAQDKPKLIVGIVVDQMRQEYLYRFEKKFSENGFKRLMNDGFMLTNAHYNYVPTFTGPGHASVFTGSTPAIHGIIANDWWDKNLRKSVNCVEDEKQKPVGSPGGNGDVSPVRLLSTTITDELKLSSQKKSKVIGLSVKDRGAVLPAGHMADAAYWYDGSTGKFISSTYYFNALPTWVEKFNELKLADEYLNKEWKTFFPIEQYTESGPDDSPFEQRWNGMDKNVFPYDLKKLKATNGNYNALLYTPFGDDLLGAFAEAALKGENLGKGDQTDFLTVSFSSPDIIGHRVGPNSIEIEDTYIRLDKNLESLFGKLDAEVGKNNYLVFLTADHAVSEIPQLLKENRIPSGNFPDGKELKDELNTFLQKQFPGKNLVDYVYNNQVFFNHELFSGDPKSSGIDLLVATDLLVNYLQAKEGVAQVFAKSAIKQGSYSEGGIKGMIVRGYNYKRSGDVVYELESGWLGGNHPFGTTHGSSYSYDTNVPMLFYGKGIAKGRSARYHTITDIAPTLSVLLKIKFPSGCTGQPITEIIDGK
ncbi:MAG TPA: alkaline phosphatase PafA, partial [Cyclobacteriaceae bacterium]|nr:alkaline phosphatase PafA [Cyclobacteriaceae bacterium]